MNFQQENGPYGWRKYTEVQVVMLAVLMGVGSFMLPSAEILAEQNYATQFNNENSGQITAVGTSDLEVEHRSYPLHPKLEIRAEGGQPLELKQLQVGMGVRLQLKDGAVAKVLVLNPK